MADGECKALDLLCHNAVLGLPVAAAVVMRTATQVVIVDGIPGSYSQYNALSYVLRGGRLHLSAVCSAVALYMFAVRAAATVVSLPLVPFLDAAVQSFLFSASGVAFPARDVLGGQAGPWGSSAGEGSVCDVAGALCGRVTVAAAVCAFAALCAAVAALAREAGCSSSGDNISLLDQPLHARHWQLAHFSHHFHQLGWRMLSIQ